MNARLSAGLMLTWFPLQAHHTVQSVTELEGGTIFAKKTLKIKPSPEITQ